MVEAFDSSYTVPNTLERTTDRTLVKTQSYVDGARAGAVDGVTLPVYDPVTNAHLVDVTSLGHAETLRVIDVANTVWPIWRGLTDRERAGLMRRWFDLLIANTDDFVALMTAEQGKPLAETKGEIVCSALFIEWSVKEAKCVPDDVMVSTWCDKRMVVLKQSASVCASIIPWNSPLAMIAREIAPTMAAGCTIVIKPAEQTPLSALVVAKLAHRVGTPEGVVNVVTGNTDRSITVGKALCEPPIVRHLSFTGSTPVDRILMQQCLPTVKKAVPELGGRALFIVFDDVDINTTVEGVVQSKYRNAGQMCVCANRFYVHASVYDASVERFSTKVCGIKVGNGFELGAVQGPLIDDQTAGKVQRHTDDAAQKGAHLTAGGKLMQGSGLQRFVEPTVLADVTPDMLIAREETFGLASVIFKFQDEAEVVRLANDTEFDLASYFFSRDIGRTWRVAEQPEHSAVGINTGLISNEITPPGGIKRSGSGREGSVYGIDEYLELKYLCTGDT